MHAFILAGGFATRLWPLTEKRAKPLLPLAGKPLLTHLVEKIPEGIPITVSTNQVFAEDFKKWKRACHGERRRTMAQGNASLVSARDDTYITILIEDAGHEDEKLGALGAVAKWIEEEKVDDDVLLLAGDNYVGFSLEALLKEFRGNPLFAAREVKSIEEAKKFGVVIPETMNDPHPVKRVVRKVIGFEEKPANPQSRLVGTGVNLLPKGVLPLLVDFAKQHPDNIGRLYTHFIFEKKIDVDYVIFDEPWFDIGSFEAYLEATKALVGEAVLDCRIPTPSDDRFQYTSILKTAPKGTDVIAENRNLFAGSVVLAKGSKVLKSHLRNVVLFEDCAIEDCILENCIVDTGCHLRGVDLTGKMLRAGTKLLRS